MHVRHFVQYFNTSMAKNGDMMANSGKSKIGSRLGVNKRACAAVVKMIFCHSHWFSLRSAPLGLVLTTFLRKVSTCTLPQMFKRWKVLSIGSARMDFKILIH